MENRVIPSCKTKPSVMQFLVIAVFFATLSPQYAIAENLFQKCWESLDLKNYAPLKQYFSANEIKGVLCQRLNDREFLYTDDRNMYYCTLGGGGTMGCEPREKSTWFPYGTIVERFTGANGKRFVLFYTNQLSHGRANNEYFVFYFVPKTVDPRGYTLIPIGGSTYNGLSSDAGGICSNLRDNDIAIARPDKEYEIFNQGTATVGIRYVLYHHPCNRGEETEEEQKLEYGWQNGEFKLLQNIRTPRHPSK